METEGLGLPCLVLAASKLESDGRQSCGENRKVDRETKGQKGG